MSHRSSTPGRPGVAMRFDASIFMMDPTLISNRPMHIADPRQIPSGVFLYTLHPARVTMLTEGPTPEEQALAGKHWAYSQELVVRGIAVFGGRTLNRDAGAFAFLAIRA